MRTTQSTGFMALRDMAPPFKARNLNAQFIYFINKLYNRVFGANQFRKAPTDTNHMKAFNDFFKFCLVFQQFVFVHF